MKQFFILTLFWWFIFLIAVLTERIIITEKAHQDIESLKNKIIEIYEGEDILDKSKKMIGKGNLSRKKDEVVAKTSEIHQKSTGIIEEKADQMREKGEGVRGFMYKTLDKIYEIYHDLFGDPLEYDKSKKT